MNATRPDALKESIMKNFFVVFLSILINSVNGSFVYIYFRSLEFRRDPRYVLFIHLVVNDMILLSISVLLQILTYTIQLSLGSCCALLLILLTTNRINPLNLACMAVERYIAVCWPLYHSQLCTVGRTYFLIALIWGLAFLPDLGQLLILLLASPGSGMFPGAFLCFAGFVFSLPQHQTARLVSQVFFLTIVSATLVVTYLKVVFTASAVSASSQASARKARNTILLHSVQLLLCMLTYVTPFVTRPLILTLPHKRSAILFSAFIITNILPRLLSPLIYGVRDQKFSTQLRLLFTCLSQRQRQAERLKPAAGERVGPAAGDRGRTTLGEKGAPPGIKADDLQEMNAY